MASTTFTAYATKILASWLNDVNTAVYTAIGDGTSVPTTAAQVLTNISALSSAAGAVGTTNLATDAVTTVKITDSNVTTAKINDSAITTAKLNNGVLSADATGLSKMADAFFAATTAARAKFADLFVTAAKLDDNVVSDLTAVTAATNDYVMIADTSDSNKKKKTLVSDILSVGPVFSATASGTTSLISATATQVLFANEEFDTNSNFASSRFTPTVAGYYRINALVTMATNTTQVLVQLYKNGAAFKNGASSNAGMNAGSVTAVVQMNGTTDYVEIFCTQSAATQNNVATALASYFQGEFIRPT